MLSTHIGKSAYTPQRLFALINLSAVGTALDDLLLRLACTTTWQQIEGQRMAASYKTAPADSRRLCFDQNLYIRKVTQSLLQIMQKCHTELDSWPNLCIRGLVCVDSYFSNVQAAEKLRVMGLSFIDIAKTATRNFPMQTLGSIAMGTRGERHTYVNKTAEGRVRVMEMVWLDRERRYFITTATSAAQGIPYTRRRWQ
jgi:hypothetical protein